MNPLVSAIIPNYNYSKYLPLAVESALNQTYRNLQVIVVDDGSTDGSLEVLRKYADRIEIIEQGNMGVCAARNRGLAASKGEYIAFLDADDYWLPEKIEKQIERFKERPNAVLVHVGVEDIDADGEPIALCLDGLEGNVSEHLLFFERPVVLGGGSGAMIKRTELDDEGGFDERLSTSADWDLFYRLTLRGPIAFVKDRLLCYRVHDSNMHSNISRMERDMLIAFEKAYSSRVENKRKSYGTLNRVLAGSYFRSGMYRDFFRTAAKSLWYQPSEIRHFATFPIRKFRSGH